jgi:hypothetical protein
MAEDKSAVILKGYREDGLTIKELADKHDVTESYVNKIVSVASQEEQETMGSIMDDLTKIIREVSKTRKLDAIIRTFGAKNPDDLEELARILSQAGIPVPDVAFIVENWAAYRTITVPDNVYKRIKGEKDTDEEFDISQLRKQRFKDLKAEAALHQLEESVEAMRNRKNKNDDDTPKFKRIRRMVPKMGKNGKPVEDEDGNPVLESVEEVVPFDYNGGGMDPATMMLLMQSQNKPKDNSDMIAMFAALAPALLQSLQPKDNSEFMALMMKQQQESSTNMMNMMLALSGDGKGKSSEELMEIRMAHEKQMTEIRISNEKQSQERQQELLKIQQSMRERDLTDRMGGMIGGLERKLEEAQRDRNLSDRQLLISAQERVLERGASEVGRNVQQVGGQLHDIMRGLTQDRLEEKRHQRNMERLMTAQRTGKTEQEVKDEYEDIVVPEVSEEDMLRELQAEAAFLEQDEAEIPPPDSEEGFEQPAEEAGE